MIKNRNELKLYLKGDKEALNIKKKRPGLFGDEIWKFEISLRKYEYYLNTNITIVSKMMKLIWHFIYHYYQIKLCLTIPPNVFDEGLSIAHYGSIVINDTAHVGKNCRIHECVNIGAIHGHKSPVIGDDVFIGTGAKILGDIYVASGTRIGAGAVLLESVYEENTTWVGVPAKCVKRSN